MYEIVQCLAVIVALGVSVPSRVATAQDVTVARVFLDVSHADYGQTSKYRIYGNPTSFEVILGISNESLVPFTIQHAAVTGRVALALILGGRRVPVTVQWHDDVLDGHMRRPVSPYEDIRVEPERLQEWRATIARADGDALESGEYTIELEMGQAFLAARADDGRRWPGHLSTQGGTRTLVLGPPAALPAEQSAAQRLRGRVALEAGREDEALAAYEQALAADPTSFYAKLDLGQLYYRLNRFREAIAPLEQALALMPRERNPVFRQLALAYVALRDEPNAARVLRMSGLSEAKLAATIQELREAVARRSRP